MLFRSHALAAPDPADTLTRINHGLLRRTIHTRFATMFYGVLTPDGALRYCCAGHEPPLLVTQEGVRSLTAGGFVLGLFGHATYEPETVTLAPGDLLIVCSDGVTEARSASDEEFGRNRLVACVQDAHGADADTVIESIMKAVRAFTTSAAQADDITLLVLRHRGA